MYWHNLNNKTIGIWGMGKEGVAAYQAVTRFARPKKIFTLDDDHLNHLKKCEVVIKSPGVSLYRPEIEDACKHGVSFTSGCSLFMANKPKNVDVIGVTGTKGKSTTSSLLYHALKIAGKSVAFGGNIGQPLLNLLLTEEKMPALVVAELSSYQCADFQGTCKYGILTNLFPEHLQWHQSHARYYADKCQMLRQAQKIFVNGKNKTVSAYLPALPGACFFNTPQTIHLKNGFFCQGEQTLFEQSALNLIGEHNAENACAVLSILQQLHVDTESAKKAFLTFQSLPHRLQTVGTYQGITFIDDSISTTPETTVAAIKAFDDGQPLTVLVGGFNRGQDFSTLIQFLSDTHSLVRLITLPDTGRQVYVLAQRAHLPATEAETIQEAVRIACQITPMRGRVLLSPGSPSYNQYKNFEERGLDFQRCIYQLKQKENQKQ